ncbi:hypothetical protein LINGRAHAP2_LOCUS24006 [Linum grandiflorum]
MVNLKIFLITMMELRVAIIGLHIVSEKRYRWILVQLESSDAIQLLLRDDDITHQHFFDVASFREMLDRA